MKILLTADPILPVPPTGYGGIERIVDGLAREYARLGHTVSMVVKAGSTCDAGQRLFWPGDNVRSARHTIRNAFALRQAVKKIRPDVVHSFSRLAYLLPVLPRRVAKVMSYQRHVGGRQIALAARLGKTSLRFTGCSDFICQQGQPSGGRWRAVPNFVDTAKFTFVPDAPADAPLVFLSRIESVKGADLAIAIAQRAGRRLLLAGNRADSGTEAEYFTQKIAPHVGKKGIEWVGEVNDATKNALLGNAAALLVPIQWDEPFGIVFVEALAAGTPVITCPRGGAPEIIEPGKTGLFIQTLAEGLDAVRRIPTLNRAACRRVVEEQFSVDVVAQQYLALYEEIYQQR
jgi:glycosyltransferase involved in cell wall biosynthesis